MEQVLETIDLDVEEPNELLFKVKVEGVEQAPAKIRLVCEGNDCAFMFNGNPAGQDGLIQFAMPVMKDRLKEGTYVARVEVLIENRCFVPVQFQVNFKKTVKVMAEQVTFASKRTSEISVSATQVVKKRGSIVEPTEDEILEAAQKLVRSRRLK